MWLLGGNRAGSRAFQAWSTLEEPGEAPDLQSSLDCHGSYLCGNGLQFGWLSANWRSVVEDADVDVVDICTSPHMHAEIAVAAAGAGKCVLREKPMTHSADETARIAAAAQAAGVSGGHQGAWFELGGSGSGYVEASANQIVPFITAIVDKGKAHPRFAEGAQVQQVVEAVGASSRANMWIEVPDAGQ